MCSSSFNIGVQLCQCFKSEAFTCAKLMRHLLYWFLVQCLKSKNFKVYL